MRLCKIDPGIVEVKNIVFSETHIKNSTFEEEAVSWGSTPYQRNTNGVVMIYHREHRMSGPSFESLSW